MLSPSVMLAAFLCKGVPVTLGSQRLTALAAFVGKGAQVDSSDSSPTVLASVFVPSPSVTLAAFLRKGGVPVTLGAQGRPGGSRQSGLTVGKVEFLTKRPSVQTLTTWDDPADLAVLAGWKGYDLRDGCGLL